MNKNQIPSYWKQNIIEAIYRIYRSKNRNPPYMEFSETESMADEILASLEPCIQNTFFIPDTYWLGDDPEICVSDLHEFVARGDVWENTIHSVDCARNLPPIWVYFPKGCSEGDIEPQIFKTHEEAAVAYRKDNP